jgi:8-oxo-dGTP pyrophosphatase MutT (NUDIX family)
MSNPRTIHFSDEFVISCGMVTLDLKAHKVLIILWRKTGEYLLPKGRKEIGEPLQSAAVRETFEETGFSCSLLPHKFPTLATDQVTGAHVDKDVEPTLEPFAVTQRTSDGKLKIIFWYLGEGDSTKRKIEGTQMEDEDFESLWVDESKVLETVTWDDDRLLVAKAMEFWKSS